MRNDKSSVLVCLFLLLGLWGFSAQVLSAQEVVETYIFTDQKLEERYQHFTQVLRCPKCQNQNLAGSNSPIANDLRRELARLLKAEKTDQEIIDFMVARFGDFVLYEPQFKKNTWLLWLAPGILFFVAFLAAFIFIRKRKSETQERKENTEQQEKNAQKKLLGSDNSILSARIAFWILTVTIVGAVAGATLLYGRLGAGEQMAISRLSQNFYAEVEQASKEGREPDLQAAQELVERLEEYVLEQPEGLASVYLLGSTYAFLSDFEQAIPHYKTYLMAIPTDERVLTEYVQILYIAAGRKLSERVQFVVDRALMLNPHNQEVLNLLAMHYFEAGDKKQAAEYWQKVLSTMSPTDDAYRMIQRAIKVAGE